MKSSSSSSSFRLCSLRLSRLPLILFVAVVAVVLFLEFGTVGINSIRTKVWPANRYVLTPCKHKPRYYRSLPVDWPKEKELTEREKWPLFNVGDSVYLCGKRPGTYKLLYTQDFGPYRIIEKVKVSTAADERYNYRLRGVPSRSLNMHLDLNNRTIFHGSVLKY